MSKGLYTVAEIARYFGNRPQEVERKIREDELPVLSLPGEKGMVRKITLHGLHGWLKGKHSGADFMGVEELAAEIEMANAYVGEGVGGLQHAPALMMARAAAAAFHEVLVSKLNAGGATA